MINVIKGDIRHFIYSSFEIGIYEPAEILNSIKSWLRVEFAFGHIVYDDYCILKDFAEEYYERSLLQFIHDDSKEG